jgi:hypothetical protein
MEIENIERSDGRRNTVNQNEIERLKEALINTIAIKSKQFLWGRLRKTNKRRIALHLILTNHTTAHTLIISRPSSLCETR